MFWSLKKKSPNDYIPETVIKKDSSITLLPSGSSRLNLKEKLPPLSPFSWIYSTKPDIRKTKDCYISLEAYCLGQYHKPNHYL